MIEHHRFGVKFGKNLYYIITKIQLHHRPDRLKPTREEHVLEARKIQGGDQFIEYDTALGDTLTIKEQEEFIQYATRQITHEYVESVIHTTPHGRPSYHRYRMILTRDYNEWLDDDEVKYYRNELCVPKED